MRRGDQLAADFHAGFQPSLPATAVFEQSGVLDGNTGSRGQRNSEVLVLVGEVLSALLLRQVQVPEDGIPDPDGDTQERLHGRMVGREA